MIEAWDRNKHDGRIVIEEYDQNPYIADVVSVINA
jgi:hypothetical protein